jgi:glycerol-3-phosphate dehydrogenase
VAAAGYSVALLEKSAVAAGTSSKSSKLIHGGLRYLENFDFKLVRESLKERELLLQIAPTLVKPQN